MGCIMGFAEIAVLECHVRLGIGSLPYIIEMNRFESFKNL